MISHARATLAHILVFVSLCLNSVTNKAHAVPSLPTAGWTFDGSGATELAAFGSHIARLENGLGRDGDTPFAYVGNQSLLMNERNEFVNIDNPNLLSERSTFTFSVWVKPTELGQDPVCPDCTVLLADSRHGGFWFEIHEESSLEFHLPSNATAITEPNLIPLDTWTHVAIVKNGSNNLIYVNGSQKAVVEDDVNMPTLTGNLRLGRFLGFSSVDYKGWMDEAAFWDVALAEEDIEFLSHNSITAIPEPSSAAVSCLGFLSLLAWRWRVPIAE